MTEPRGYKKNLADIFDCVSEEKYHMNFGHKPNHHPAYKFARNPAVGQSYEEIWDASTNKTRLTSASTMRVKASTGTIAVTCTYGGVLVKTSEIGNFPDL